MNGRTVKEDILHVIRRAIVAVDPERRVAESLAMKGGILDVCGRTFEQDRFRNVWVLGAGKASEAMARAVENALGDCLAGGMVATKTGSGAGLGRIELALASHPVPDERSELAARKALELARSLSENDLLICLLSGGASALWSLPADGLHAHRQGENNIPAVGLGGRYP